MAILYRYLGLVAPPFIIVLHESEGGKSGELNKCSKSKDDYGTYLLVGFSLHFGYTRKYLLCCSNLRKCIYLIKKALQQRSCFMKIQCQDLKKLQFLSWLLKMMIKISVNL